MKPQEYEVMYHAEEKHWLYQGMAAITMGLLRRWYASGTDLHILDAGCGTGGAMTTNLAELGTVTGLAISKRALQFCQRRRTDRPGCAVEYRPVVCGAGI